jgi:putative redox protein
VKAPLVAACVRLASSGTTRLAAQAPARQRRCQQQTMSLTASARSTADTLRQEILVDGRHHLVTDEPARLGGTDEGPTPHELLPAALAGCIATTVRMYARTKGWHVSELSVDVVYDHKATPRHFDVTVHLPDGLDPEQVRRLMRVAEACPVRRAIEAGMSFDEHLPEPVLDAQLAA